MAVSGQPLAVEEVVSGKLLVRIFSHVIQADAGPVPCWTYVSAGLLVEGQSEIAFSVKRETGESEGAFPRQLLDLYSTIHHFAAQGQYVGEGGVTKIDPRQQGLLRHGFHGVLYTPGQSIDGVETPSSFLTAIILSDPELEVALQFGSVRMMSLLGKHYRFFPTAPWLDRRRDPIVSPDVMNSSILTNVAGYRLFGACVRMDTPPDRVGQVGGRVVLTLTRSAARSLVNDLKALGPDISLGVLVDLDPEASSILVWEPEHGTSAISQPGATGDRFAGNFLLIVNVSDNDGANLVEDGFGLFLRQETWARVRRALEEGRPLEVPGTGDLMHFALNWVEES